MLTYSRGTHFKKHPAQPQGHLESNAVQQVKQGNPYFQKQVAHKTMVVK